MGKRGKWVPRAQTETIHAEIFDTMQSEMVTIAKITSVATESWAVELFNKQAIYLFELEVYTNHIFRLHCLRDFTTYLAHRQEDRLNYAVVKNEASHQLCGKA